MSETVATAVRRAAAVLAQAGVDTPLVDAQLLAAHLLDCGRMDVFLYGDKPMPQGYTELVARRAERQPLQWLTGTAPVGDLDLSVGPGVFIPRPETELVAQWGIAAIADIPAPRIVDLCAGSGTLALLLATARPDARVWAVERDATALEWTRTNVAAHAPEVTIVAADATDPNLLAELHGTVDLVVSNPPYVPETYKPHAAAEVGCDPDIAVYGGPDGMSVIRPLIPVIHGLLSPTGHCAIEHDDATGSAVRGELIAYGGFGGVDTHCDLAQKDRFTTARKL